jgi:hypothetical protein
VSLIPYGLHLGGDLGTPMTSAGRWVEAIHGAPRTSSIGGEHSVSGFDLTQRFVQTVIYDVPFFKSMQGAVSTSWMAGS